MLVIAPISILMPVLDRRTGLLNEARAVIILADFWREARPFVTKTHFYGEFFIVHYQGKGNRQASYQCFLA